MLYIILALEYAGIYFPVLTGQRERVYLLGYICLLVVFFGSNHGRNVKLPYENQISIVLKCICANCIQGLFLYGADGVQALQVFMLCDLQIITVVVYVWFQKITRSYQKDEKLLLIQMKSSKEITASDYNQNLEKKVQIWHSYKNHELLELEDYPNILEVRGRIRESDVVYIHDVPAELRNDLLKICYGANKKVITTTKISDVLLRSADVMQDHDGPVFRSNSSSISSVAVVLKRLIDVTLSFVALVCLSPLFLVISILIKLEDGGPVFYRQTRCTIGQKEFQIYKFRSMIHHAERKKGKHLSSQDDSRVTRIGAFIRHWKLDELPQLINIFKGDMSIVGPRPERPEIIREIAEELPEFVLRTKVKAGLTGYAQIKGNYYTDYLDKLKWDIFYIENYSLLLDFKIVCMTIPSIIRQRKTNW